MGRAYGSGRWGAHRSALALAGSILTALAAAGCGGSALVIQPIHESSDRYVGLAGREATHAEWATRRFAHPIALTEREWELVLQVPSVTARTGPLSIPSQAENPEPAFRESERQYLSKHFANSLSIAGPDQMSVFYLSRRREAAIMEITSGGCFVRDNAIHIVFANYRMAVTMDSLHEQIRTHPLRHTGNMLYDFVPNPRNIQSVSQWHWSTPLLGRAWDVTIDHHRLLALPSGIGLNGTPQGGAGRSQAGPGSHEVRLQTLERLFREGLLSQEEYQAIRLRILNEL